MFRITINRPSKHTLINPISIITQNFRPLTSNFVQYSVLAAAVLDETFFWCIFIGLGLFDTRFFYLEFWREDSVTGREHVDNYLLDIPW